MNIQTDILTIRIKYKGIINLLNINKNCTVKDIINFYIKHFLHSNYDASKFTLKMKGVTINHEETLLSYINDINNNCAFDLIFGNIIPECYIMNVSENENKVEKKYKDEYKDDYKDEDKDEEEDRIDIKFFKKNINIFNNYAFQNLFGLLKLCLLKEIAITNEFENLMGLPEKIANLMMILRRGKKNYKNIPKGIIQLLKRKKGLNIINFSKFVDGLINQNEINTILIPRLSYSRNNILYIYNILGKYIDYAKLFELEFERAKRHSLFEYSIISTAIIEREKIDEFELNRLRCPFRIDRVLFHGTSYNAISKILPEMFERAKKTQHGNGVYFTEDLDSCWIYGSEKKSNNTDPNDRRCLEIPNIGDCFCFIASAIYYDKNALRLVNNREKDPIKNGVNFAFAGMKNLESVSVSQIDRRRFYGTEYVINDLNQICPFLAFKLKRDEYCIIWRDTNFSNNQIYGNQFDKTFKNHLGDLMEKIIPKAKYNIYPCSTSKDALKLIIRKKYNKIILISNIGNDNGGRAFIDDARKIIGSNVIVLFNAYNINHLDWVKNYTNALFTNVTEFFEEYLNCFYGKTLDETKNALLELKRKIEQYYNNTSNTKNIRFNFDEASFLHYPNAEKKDIKRFNQLYFDYY